MDIGSNGLTKILSTLGDTVTMDVGDYTYAGVQLTGTWTGTVTFEVSIDGVTFVAFNMTPSNSGTDASTSSGNGGWSKLVAGYKLMRARFSTASSGSVTASLWAS